MGTRDWIRNVVGGRGFGTYLSLRASNFEAKQPQFMGGVMPYFVYIMTTQRNTALYTGITNDLKKRIAQHKLKLVDGLTKRYNVNKLMFYEMFESVKAAIAREKQIKSGSRQKKIDLIRRMNLKWE